MIICRRGYRGWGQGVETEKFAAQYDRYFTFPACFNKTIVISSPDRPHRSPLLNFLFRLLALTGACYCPKDLYKVISIHYEVMLGCLRLKEKPISRESNTRDIVSKQSQCKHYPLTIPIFF